MRTVNPLRPAGSAQFYSLDRSKFLDGMHLSVVSKQRQSSSALPSATRSAMQPVLAGFPETGYLSASFRGTFGPLMLDLTWVRTTAALDVLYFPGATI